MRLPRSPHVTLAVVLVAGGCSTWTSVHAGYGRASDPELSVAGIEIEHARTLGDEVPYVLVGARVDGNDHTQELAAHVGLLARLPLGSTFTLAPLATVELGRVSRIDGGWYGGAGTPGVGVEFVGWLHSARRLRTWGNLGCMGGVVGFDCPRSCQVDLMVRDGIGLRVAAEYDVRFGSGAGHDLRHGALWISLGYTHAVTEDRATECCHYDYPVQHGRNCPEPKLVPFRFMPPQRPTPPR
jgi:hypothetical protein